MSVSKYFFVGRIWAFAGLLLVLGKQVAWGGYAEEIIKLEPHAYWRFNEGEGEIELENQGVAEAYALYKNEAAKRVPGLIPTDPSNKAARFDGDTGDDLTGISITNYPELNTGGPWLGKTTLLWFNADDVAPVEEQILYEEGGATRGQNIFISEGRLYVGGWNRADDDGGLSTPWLSDDENIPGGVFGISTPIEKGKTYHVALVYSGVEEGWDGTITGYLNGVPFGSKAGAGQLYNHPNASTIGAVTSETHLALGPWTSGNGLYFKGVIDDIALFNEPFTAESILKLYQAGVGSVVKATGDFNGDGQLDATDLELLSTKILGQANDTAYDVNADSKVDLSDRLQWVESLKKTWIGDANLDGKFDSADFVGVFAAGEYEDAVAGNSTWQEGDWNGDADFTSADFVSAFAGGGYEQGARAAVSAVPEPASFSLAIVGSLWLGLARRKSSTLMRGNRGNNLKDLNG